MTQDTRTELDQYKQAFNALTFSKRYQIVLRYNIEKDPASGRTEWDSIQLPLEDVSLVDKVLQSKIRDLSLRLAKELREEAEKLEKFT